MRGTPSLGAFVHERGTTFRAWSTIHARCAVRLYDDAGGASRDLAMEARGDHYHEVTAPGVGHGARYRFVLDGEEVGDPYARFLPGGVDEPAMVYQARHAWRHAPVSRPLREHVIYELHVGTFTDEGTYAAATAWLPELARLGVTAIELLPVAAFGGAHGWGYDGVAHYAPHAPYGTPDDLRAFVDAAHGCGLAMLLDVVYNHFGPAGNVLRRHAPDYFASDITNAWGEAPDYRVPQMRQYAVENARYWLEDFRFDGLRLDAVHAIVDPSERHVVRELVERARGVGRPVVLIAEDDRDDPALVAAHGFDAVWADDFHHAVHVTLTGERDGYYARYEPGAASIARAVEARGDRACALPLEGFVYCLQNHDQVGNRAVGDRLSSQVSTDAYGAMTALLLFLPMTPLLFQGQEWAASTPFAYFTDHDPALGKLVSAGRREEFKRFAAFSDPAARERIPDPQARATFTRSKLRRDERAREPHARVLALHHDLLALRAADPVIRTAARTGLAVTVDGDVLTVTLRAAAGERRLYLNAGAAPRPRPWGARDRVLLATTAAAHDALPPWSATIVAPAASPSHAA